MAEAMNQKEKQMSLLSSLWRYLKNPDYDLKPILSSFWGKFFDILRYWSLGVLLALFAGIVSALILNNAGIDDSQNVLQDFFADNSIFFIILLVFFLGPVSEEITFRLALRYSPYRFGIFLGFTGFLLFEVLVATNKNLLGLVDRLINLLGVFWFFGLILCLIIFSGLLAGWIISKTKLLK